MLEAGIPSLQNIVIENRRRFMLAQRGQGREVGLKRIERLVREKAPGATKHT